MQSLQHSFTPTTAIAENAPQVDYARLQVVAHLIERAGWEKQLGQVEQALELTQAQLGITQNDVTRLRGLLAERDAQLAQMESELATARVIQTEIREAGEARVAQLCKLLAERDAELTRAHAAQTAISNLDRNLKQAFAHPRERALSPALAPALGDGFGVGANDLDDFRALVGCTKSLEMDDSLTEQLAERDAMIADMSRELSTMVEEHARAMREALSSINILREAASQTHAKAAALENELGRTSAALDETQLKLDRAYIDMESLVDHRNELLDKLHALEAEPVG